MEKIRVAVGLDAAEERSQLRDIIATLVDFGFVIQEDDRYLSISVPWLSSYQPGAEAVKRMNSLFLETAGAASDQVTLTSKARVRELVS